MFINLYYSECKLTNTMCFSLEVQVCYFRVSIPMDISIHEDFRCSYACPLFSVVSSRVHLSCGLSGGIGGIYFQKGSFNVAKRHKESKEIIFLAKYFCVSTRTLRRWKKYYLQACLRMKNIPSDYDFYCAFPEYSSYKIYRDRKNDIEFGFRVKDLKKYFDNSFTDGLIEDLDLDAEQDFLNKKAVEELPSILFRSSENFE